MTTVKEADYITLNDTEEEKLRRMLIEAKQENNALLDHIELLKRNIKEEQDGKYRAYVKISDLQQELKKFTS
jgi:hypothetical protein|tara:strand:+ start:200 stop:415 length:216 start_codon:yes stop_codon:yes gene_type:complete